MGALYSQKKVRPAWTKARKEAGNLQLGQCFVGGGGIEQRLATKTDRRFRTDEEGELGEGAPWRWDVDWRDSGLSTCNEDVITKLRTCYGGQDLQSRKLFYRVPKDLCAKSSAVESSSHSCSLFAPDRPPGCLFPYPVRLAVVSSSRDIRSMSCLAPQYETSNNNLHLMTPSQLRIRRRRRDTEHRSMSSHSPNGPDISRSLWPQQNRH